MMKIRIAFLFIISLFVWQPTFGIKTFNAKTEVGYMDLSIQMLNQIKNGESVDEIVKLFAESSLEVIENEINSDQIKIAFWVNVYNAYILYILNENPEYYEDRRSFFKKPFVKIAGQIMSFSDIEHGIIRGSQHEYFLGYMRRWFPPKYQKKLRPSKRDYRVHFALNCGAKSCPPIQILKLNQLEEQLNQMTATYLKSVSSYDAENKSVITTPLCSWFRGDFKGKKGIKKMLFDLDLIPTPKVKLEYGDYDWTLALNNFYE